MSNANIPEYPWNHKGCTCNLLGLAMFMGAPICISMRWDWPYYVAGSGPVKGISLCHASGTPDITGAAPTGFPALKHGQREV